MAKYRIENRTPTEAEIPELIDLLNRTWLTAHRRAGFCQFDRPFFDLYACSPLQREDGFWLAIHEQTHRIIGFALAMPRRVRVRGAEPQPLAYGSLITVAPEYQQGGVARAIAESARALAVKERHPGSIVIVQAGSRGLRALGPDLAREAIPVWTHEHAYIRPLGLGDFGKDLDLPWYGRLAARFLQGVKPVDEPRIRDVQPDDLPQVLALLNDYGTRLDFARVWTGEELASYHRNPIVTGKVWVESGTVLAVVHAVRVQFGIKGKVRPLGILENLHYERLRAGQQNLLVRALLWELQQGGATLATDFAIGYTSPAPIRANRFVPYERKMTFYFLPAAGPDGDLARIVKQGLGSTYIDIR